MKRTFKFIVTVEVDSVVVREKYPNFDLNYTSVKQFAQTVVVRSGGDPEYGYKVTAVPMEG